MDSSKLRFIRHACLAHWNLYSILEHLSWQWQAKACWDWDSLKCSEIVCRKKKKAPVFFIFGEFAWITPLFLRFPAEWMSLLSTWNVQANAIEILVLHCYKENLFRFFLLIDSVAMDTSWCKCRCQWQAAYAYMLHITMFTSRGQKKPPRNSETSWILQFPAPLKCSSNAAAFGPQRGWKLWFWGHTQFLFLFYPKRCLW